MIDRLLTLRVIFRDEPAAAEITPEMAAAYLTARGWTERPPLRDGDRWRVFMRDGRGVGVPRETRFIDYGRRMVELVNDLAEIEGRSPLAVWAEMMQEKKA